VDVDGLSSTAAQNGSPPPQKASRRRRAIVAGSLAGLLAVGSVGIGALTTYQTSVLNNSAGLTTSKITVDMAITGDPFHITADSTGTWGDVTRTWTLQNGGNTDVTWDGVFQLQAGTDISRELAAITHVYATISGFTADALASSLDVSFDLGTLADPVPLSEAAPISTASWLFSGTLSTGLTAKTTTSFVTNYLSSTALTVASGKTGTFTVTAWISDADHAALAAEADPDGVGNVRLVARADFVASYMQAD
jgi:hypothetical protein